MTPHEATQRGATGRGARPLEEARELLHDLAALGDVRAPRTLLPAILDAIGPADTYFPLAAPIGTVYVAYNDEGISAVMPADDRQGFERTFRSRFGRPIRAASTLPERLERALRRRLAGEGGRQSLRFDLRGLSEFERAVLLKALDIPRGEVRPYNWVAHEIGHGGAVRAVGSALNKNPIPLLIPCHRVIRGDGRMGEYAFGNPAKQRMLASEGIEPAALEALAQQGTRYLGSDTTGVYCFPTCRNARRITDRHRVPFRTAAAATSAGYRPCRICRPALAS